MNIQSKSIRSSAKFLFAFVVLSLGFSRAFAASAPLSQSGVAVISADTHLDYPGAAGTGSDD